MGFSNQLVKHISYPLWMIKDRKAKLYKYLWEYGKYNSLSLEQIRLSQKNKLMMLLKHAFSHSRYYRLLFEKCGIIINDFVQPEKTLKKLPILTKEIIGKNIDTIIADNISKNFIFQDSTGGSTGIPLVFYRDRECLIKRRAQELFFDKWIGYELGDKVALFVAARHHPKGIKGIKARLRNATCSRMLAFDPYRTDKKYMEIFLAELIKFKPDVIKCFPNSLYIFADFLKKKGFDKIRVRSVSCTGETLHDYQRSLFQEVFQCPVFEKYGSFEIGVAACECSQHKGMHLFMDGVYFEFITSDGKAAKPDEIAQLIVTDLFNYGFPLIRYRIGDVGMLSEKPCECGSPLPLMSKLYGRDRDILTDQNGNPKPGYLFVEVFNKHHIPGQFQVIQENRDSVLVRAVKKDGYLIHHEKLILEKFKVLLGKGMKIRFEYVEEILRESSGKFKYVHSMISPFS